MLTPIKSPLACFGLEHDARTERCRECPHREECRAYSGNRLGRVTLDQVVFDLVPDTIQYRDAECDEDARDVEALYAITYRQVFGNDPNGSVGRNKLRLIDLARAAKCSIPMFMLTAMFAHSKASPKETFTPGTLVDGRALGRVKLYADACRARYASFDVYALAQLTRTDSAEHYDLDRRMLESEVLAGRWTINFKLESEGPPYPAIFEELEKDLDPNWLAVEPHYAEVIEAYSRRESLASNSDTKHAILDVYARLKSHKHEAIGNFRAREKAMPKAIKTVLGEIEYTPRDFEIREEPITDPLRFWQRLGLAVQHMECLKKVAMNTGIYSG